MTERRHTSTQAQRWSGVVLGLATIALLSTASAAAATTTECKTGGGVVHIAGQDVVLDGPNAEGNYVGQGAFTIDCVGGASAGPITDTSIQLAAQATSLAPDGSTPAFTIGAFQDGAGNPVPSTPLAGNPEKAGPFDAQLCFTITSNTAQLDLVAQTADEGVGAITQTVLNSSGGVTGRFVNNLIFAQTPELASVALFGSGAAGMAGYALMRLRAARPGRR